MNSLYPNPHPDSCPWHQAAEIVGAPNIKWCETTTCSWISEPANTWSNLLYMIFGLMVWQMFRSRKEYELTWMGPAMFLMGLFSLIYHASNNYITQILDFVGMYIFVFWLMVINFRRVGWIQRKQQVPLLVALSIACTALIHVCYTYGIKFQAIVAVAAVTIVATEVMARSREPKVEQPLFFISGIGFLVAAQIASLMDVNRIWCEPDHPFLQGHAIWHILAAIGLYLAVLHYKQLSYEESA